MRASSVLRIPLLLRLADCLALSRSRVGSGRRALVAVSLFVVAFSIVGMHQLLLDHQVATPAPLTVSVADAPGVGHRHSDLPDHEMASPVSVALPDSGLSSPHGSPVVDALSGSPGGHDEGCPGCGSHTMAFGACLLALTLLVLSWWLAPPRVRLLPPRLLAWASAVIPELGRRVPALSLAELSILRM